MYDVIVVGARVAGAPTAMLLARQGYRVLLLDRSSFPSDTVSTHMISCAGVAQLKHWGLLERVAASNCPAVTNIILDLAFEHYGAFTLTGFPPPDADGFAAIYAPKRIYLDKILVDAAVEAGVELRENFTVRDLIVESGRVTGVVGSAPGGSTVRERAPLVIGADGKHSLVARSAGAPKYATKPAGTCGYYTYWNNVPIDSLEFYTRPSRTIVAFPTNDQQAAIFVEWTNQEFEAFKADLEGNFVGTLKAIAPDLARRVRGGQRAHRFMGTADLPNFFRRPHGPGWALVGDAGFHKDPITAQGITDAFRDAELLARAVDRGFSGQQPIEAALEAYEQQRNATIMPLYEFICDRATLAPFPLEFQQVLAALRGNQEAIDRFFGVIQNTVPFHEFFSPENLIQILQSGSLEAATA